MRLRSILAEPGLYFNRLLQELDYRTSFRISKPSEVWLKLTERCNCRCAMCEIWQHNRTNEGELSTWDWMRVLKGLRSWLGPKHIWMTGGEPFLRPDAIELIGHASGIGLSVGVITNGTILKPEKMEALAAAGLREYHTSIDAMTPEIHDRLRGLPGAHKRASNNVLALKDLRNRNGTGMKLVIKTIIMGVNADEIIPLVDWVEGNGFDEIKFQPLESNLEGNDDPLWFQKSSYWPKGDRLKNLLRVIDSLIARKDTGAPIYNSQQELRKMRDYFQDPVRVYEKVKAHVLGSDNDNSECRCAVGWMEILSRGELRFCRHMPGEGDVRLSSPRKLWRRRTACWQNRTALCHKP
ncbi:MAG: radical SAM protein [Deltaproteobacteria bacterium]|nr:radical SAM protein [Deltaproteobacteria bacterium]